MGSFVSKPPFEGPSLDEWHRALFDHKIAPTALAWPLVGVRKTMWQEGAATVSVGWRRDGAATSNALVVVKLDPAPEFGGWATATPETPAAGAAAFAYSGPVKAITFIQFPGRGTWIGGRRADGVVDVGAPFTLLHLIRDLPIIRRRAQQLAAGEGRAPERLSLSAVMQLPRALFAVRCRISQDHVAMKEPGRTDYVSWPW